MSLRGMFDICGAEYSWKKVFLVEENCLVLKCAIVDVISSEEKGRNGHN